MLNEFRDLATYFLALMAAVLVVTVGADWPPLLRFAVAFLGLLAVTLTTAARKKNEDDKG
jgi:hypothetical protein